jgi:hypothetical protein
MCVRAVCAVASCTPVESDIDAHMPKSALTIELVFLELGRALYVFQAIEARLKMLLPHFVVPGTDEPAKGEGWEGRRKYLDSKEMLGNLVKLLHSRTTWENPGLIEAEWREVVQGRNDVVHNFSFQPFSKCETREEIELSLEYLRTRRTRALPLLHMLDVQLRGLVVALQLPPDFEGEIPVELPDWWNPNAV